MNKYLHAFIAWRVQCPPWLWRARGAWPLVVVIIFLLGQLFGQLFL